MTPTLYHIFSVNDRTGAKVQMTEEPMPLHQAQSYLRKCFLPDTFGHLRRLALSPEVLP